MCDGSLVIDLSLMRGVFVDPAARIARVQGGAIWGDVDRETQLLAPMREFATPMFDLSGSVPYVWIQSGFDASFPKGDRYYQKARDLDYLSDEVIQELCASVAEPPSPQTIVEVLHNGGAMSRVGTEETAYGRRNAPYYVNVSTHWTDPIEDAVNIAWARDCWASLGKFSSGGMYLNFPGFGEEKEDLVRTGYGSNYARLTHIKAKYDPTNLFRMNQNISPAT